ncbi:MAG TPA: hypothetical protein VFN68_13995 [Acidimicrobiales bacterium]|nr:hypothetical protein [Acidimicrobiales bacterium]
MIATPTPGTDGRAGRPISLARLAALPVAAVLAALALSSWAGIHQAAGALLVAGVVWAGYGVVVRLFPGLDAVPALVLAGMLGACVVALLVVAVYAAGVTVTPSHMVITVAAGAAALVVVGEVLGRAAPRMRWWASRRTVTFAVLTATACGLLVVDAGAVTARLAPRSAPAPYSAFGFAGPAARWSQELEVSPGQVLTVPLQIVNHTGHRARFVVQSQIGGTAQTLATVEVGRAASWTASFPVAMPETGCPSRLVFTARSAATTEMLDVWLQWNDPSCA